MEEKGFYTASELANILSMDAQTLREQAKYDIAQGPTGPNGTNLCASKIGSKVIFSKPFIDKKFGIGPAFKIDSALANALIRLGMAVEAKEEA